MIMKGAQSKRHIAFCVALFALLFARIALGCDQPSTLREADPEEIRAFFKARQENESCYLPGLLWRRVREQGGDA